MQMQLPMAFNIASQAYDYGERSSGATHGVVLTKPHIVDLILDLVGYRSDDDLGGLSLLEPSCGTGAFLIRAARRLMESAAKHARPSSSLVNCLTGVDIDLGHVQETRAALCALLVDDYGVARTVASELAAAWVQHTDFLLAPERRYNFVVGNPPYVRIEQIAPVLQAQYRARYATIYDRADLYVAFIERGLAALAPGGMLGYICADRWILNKYGAPLRELVATSYRLVTYIDLHDASPFESEVIAYPSVFVIGTGATAAVRVAKLTTASEQECRAVAEALGYASADSSNHGVAMPQAVPGPAVETATFDTWFSGSTPWTLSSPEHLRTLRALEARLPCLEDDGQTQVRIGVATGADEAYIVNADVDIERDRLVPLVLRDDIVGGEVRNGGRYVINAFGPDGKIVDLQAFPRLAAYLDRHPVIRQRHVAKKNPRAWFRTIDRVYPELAQTPKLLVPDIAGSNQVVFEPGRYHPHHNLYFITSKSWDLEVLGGLLSSRVALFFVWSYAVKMRGGYLRFQAQYLRRIRVPRPGDLSTELAADVKSAYRARDFARLDALALQAYGLAQLPEFDFVDLRA